MEMSSKGLVGPVRSLTLGRNSSKPAYSVWARCCASQGPFRRSSRAFSVKHEYREQTLVPLRKQLKEDAKRKRSQSSQTLPSDAIISSSKEWQLTVGIEIHAELNTAQKLFSEASAESIDTSPNANISLFDLAYPGSQPHFQRATLLPALRAAIALNCQIQRYSSFDRKHYFYQDQPAGYQITQYYEPFARDGYIKLYAHDGIAPEDGEEVTIGIKQIQMEQDTAKTIQNPPTEHMLDFNRVSHPLIEIITLPHIHHPATAAALVRKVQNILKSVDACTTGMELGGLRADVNVSVRNDAENSQNIHSYYGVTGLGQRTEIKNLSSFKAVEDAIIAERTRQINVLEAGGVIDGETRGWILGSAETRKLRGKEGEIDYRYMPDPDIPPLILSSNLIEHLRQNLPQLPDQVLALLTENSEHGLTMKDAKTLLSFDDGDRLEFYLEVLERVAIMSKGHLPPNSGRVVANWIIHELGALLSKFEVPWSGIPVSAEDLGSIIQMVQGSRISKISAKKVLTMRFSGDARSVDSIVAEDGMLIENIGREAYIVVAEKLISENVDMVQAITTKGQQGKVMWFVGQMMRRMAQEHGKGSVNAETAKSVIQELLDVESSTRGG